MEKSIHYYVRCASVYDDYVNDAAVVRSWHWGCLQWDLFETICIWSFTLLIVAAAAPGQHVITP